MRSWDACSGPRQAAMNSSWVILPSASLSISEKADFEMRSWDACSGLSLFNSPYMSFISRLSSLCDGTVAVDIKDSEDLAEHLFGGAVRHDVEHHHELREVNVAVIIGVVDPKDVFLHSSRVFFR